MYFLMDNFTLYSAIGTANMDITWLSKVYTIIEGSTVNLRNQVWSTGRTGIGTYTATSGVRSIYLPVGNYLQTSTKLNITQRLLDYLPVANAPIGGISMVGPTQEDCILAFGFHDTKTFFVRYVGSDNIVKEDTSVMGTSLTGTEDLIEWGFQKTANDRSQYVPFVVWVNNKPVYTNSVFNQLGSVGATAAMVNGTKNLLSVGSTSTNGTLQQSGNSMCPRGGITDLVVNDGARNGLVRVLSRSPTADLSPNSFTPNGTPASHAALVGTIPPNASSYLSAVTASAEELYAANSFSNLSSEAVLAIGINSIASKNNPFALDLAAEVRISGVKSTVGSMNLDLTPGFSTIIVEKNPNTNLSWTALEANSVNFGVKVV